MTNQVTPQFPEYNFATQSFLKRMADKEVGSYVVIGKTGSGKTQLLREYVTNFPNNVRIACFEDAPGEFDGIPGRKYTAEMKSEVFQSRPNVIVSDIPHNFDLWSESIMASITTNVGLSAHGNSIEGFLYTEKENRTFQMGTRNLLNNVKGITYTEVIVLDNGVRRIFAESLLVNSDLIKEMFSLESEHEIGDFIEWEMALQGAATIKHQVAAYNNLHQ